MAATLYRLFATDGELLYIGESVRPFERLGQHARTQSWYGSVATASFEHFATKAAAVAAETEAISSERPRFNARLVHAAVADARDADTDASYDAGYHDCSNCGHRTRYRLPKGVRVATLKCAECDLPLFGDSTRAEVKAA